MKRRRFITSASAMVSVVAAGCNSNSPPATAPSEKTERTKKEETKTESPTPTTHSASPTAEPTAEPTILFNDSTTIAEGESSSAEFSISEPAIVQYDFTVWDNVEIDLLVMTLENFKRYRSRQSFTTVQTVEGSGATGNIRVSPGNYYVVFDHSDRGPTSPPSQLGQVTATVEGTISYQID